MSYPFDTNDMLFPGMDSVLETVQNQFWWGRNEQQTFMPATIAAATTDAGNTVTTVLRSGLLLGKITASGLLKAWNPTGTDGSEVLYGVLVSPLSMLDAGVAADRYAFVMVRGNLYSDRLIVPGNATEGIVGDAQEFNIVNQLVDRGWLLDKHIQYGNPLTYRPVVKAADFSVLTSDHGKTFYVVGASGAVAASLPEPQVGLTFSFVNGVAQTVTLDMTTGKFVTPGAITTDTISLTLGEQVTLTGITSALYRAQITEAATD
jgi:hypothetical protein